MNRVRFAILLVAMLAPLQAAAQLHPNHARGFDAEKAYQFGEVDHVNLFSGNLIVTLPIGQAFAVSGQLQYRLQLVYNGNPWNYMHDGDTPAAYPSHFMNAGIGWQLTLGDLVAPDDPRAVKLKKEGHWVYGAPDGSERVFFSSLHQEEAGTDYEASETPGDGDVAGYTRDSSYIRLVRIGLTDLGPVEIDPLEPEDAPAPHLYEARYAAEFPDGTIHTFTSERVASIAPPDRAYERSAKYHLTGIEDRFGNTVTIATDASTRTITDSVGRQHTIEYVDNEVYHFRGDPVRTGLVTSVRLTGPGTDTLEYVFTYGGLETISTPCAGTHPVTSPTTSARFLKSVSARKAAAAGATANPPLLTWSMENFTVQADEGCSFMAGHLTKLTLPTGGEIQYAPGFRRFPSEREGLPGEWGVIPPLNFSAAVGGRTVVGTDGVEATWTYRSFLRNLGHWFNEERNTIQSIFRELAVVVTDPLGRSTANYFNAYIGLGDLGCFPAADKRDYGLPFTRTKGHGAGGLLLSSEVFPSQCVTFVQNLDSSGCPTLTSCKNSSGNTVLPTRRTYQKYEYDSSDTIRPENRNQRVAASRTTFLDDTGCGAATPCYTESSSSDFDGLGHYRFASQSSNFPGTPVRTVETTYDANPAAGTYTSGADPDTYMLAPSDPWLLNLHSGVATSQGTSTLTQQTCFDRATGVVTRTRALAGSSAAENDLVTAYAYTNGNVTTESRYGGDATPLPAMTDDCSSSAGTAAYTLTHGYTSGVRTSTQYSGATFKSLDLTVDADTSLPTASRDTAEVPTNLKYDVLGRLVEAQPEGEARTEYTYDLASRPAAVIAKTLDGTTVVAERRHYYDGLGRLIQTRSQIPGGWAVTVATYDLLGRPVTRSMAETASSGDYGTLTPANATTFTYDLFGRVTKVETPDGKSTTVAYTGTRIVDRTAVVGAKSVTTRETYDGHGRLTSVTEDLNGAAIETEYGYDAGNRLATVSTTAEGITQTREFTYDGRGLLVSEKHPEKGADGNGLTLYPEYDAGGHVLWRIDGTEGGSYDLRFTYDSAERLTKVEDLVPNTSQRRTLKEFVYSAANGAGDASKGKLVSAKRYNYLPDLGTVTVSESYTYSGIGGRPATRSTVVGDIASFKGASFTFGQSWNALGLLASVTYPANVNVSQPRTVTYGYTNGLLTSVAGYATEVTYHANGLLDELTHANGVVERWEADHGMARPRTITATPPRQQPVWTYGDFEYDADGNIMAIGATSYDYDGLRRLVSWTETANGAFSTTRRFYDAFGNFLSSAFLNCTAPAGSFRHCSTSSVLPLKVTENTNHYQGDTYDDAGSVTSDGFRTYGYDGAGMMVSLSGAGRNERYLYTADDERIATADLVSGKTTWTLRGTDNRLLRTFTRASLTGTTGWSWTEDEIWRGSQLLASESPAGRKHYHLDHLGSPRLVTDSTGNRLGEQTFTPFGTGGTSDAGRIQFTGHEADHHGGEQGLIYAHARYLETEGRGRFLSVDPSMDLKANLPNPQRWNRYSYVSNNPINKIDPDGRDEYAMDQRLLGIKDDWHGRDKYQAAAMGVAAVAVAAGVALPEVAAATAPMWMPLAIRAQPLINAVQNFFSGETGTPTVGGFRAAGSAIGKAEATAAKFGMSADALVKTTVANGGKFVDQAHGTINVFMARPDGKSGFVRVTMDAKDKVVSVGLVTAANVRNGIKEGRYKAYLY